MISSRVRLLVLSAIVAVVVGWFLLDHPVAVKGPAFAEATYPPPPVVPGLRFYVFNTGENRMASLLVGDRRPWRPPQR